MEYKRKLERRKKVVIKEKVQSFGNFISSMIIPNIGAFMNLLS